jgi:hypothetical protein
MNPKRLIAAIAVVFVGIWIMDFLIHGVLLQNTYKETMSLWRPESEMQAHMGWLMLGQFIAAATFVLLWARGFAALACLRCAVIYGALMGLFSQVSTLVGYAIQPLPPGLAVKWFISGIAEGVLMGLLVFAVYKPKLPQATL